MSGVRADAGGAHVWFPRQPADALRAAGLSVTRPRVAVLEWLDDHPHATAVDILAGVRDGGGRRIALQTVYGVLRACVGGGLVTVVHLPGRPAQFVSRTDVGQAPR